MQQLLSNECQTIHADHTFVPLPMQILMLQKLMELSLSACPFGGLGFLDTALYFDNVITLGFIAEGA